jgi:hypothetical protein
MKVPIVSYLKNTPAHPFLLGILLVLEVWRGDPAEVSAGDFLVSALIMIGICLLIYSLFYLISKRIVAAALATSFLISILSYYLPFLIRFRTFALKLNLGGIARHMILMPFVVLMGGGIIGYFVRSRRSHLRLNAYLNILFTVLTAIFFIRLLGTVIIKRPNSLGSPTIDSSSLKAPARFHQQPGIHLGYLPDIYFIVFDSYTNSESLKKYWNYENSVIESYLQSRKFFMAAHSRVQFPSTVFSIAADLNTKEYVQGMPRRSLVAEIGNSRAIKYVLNAGYELVNYSIFDLPSKKKHYELSLYKEDLWLIEKIFQRSIIGMIKTDYIDSKRGVIEQRKIMAHLKEGDLASGKEPRFIYAHFMITHPPAMIDRDGKILAFRRTSPKEGYLDQIHFANKMIVEMVDAILAKSKNPPIIIIQGDHGSRTLKGDEWNAESYWVFNAFYLPQNTYEAYGNDMTPSITLGKILEQYLGYE